MEDREDSSYCVGVERGKTEGKERKKQAVKTEGMLTFSDTKTNQERVISKSGVFLSEV